MLDTAPTGHTLPLLDTTGSYHREIVRNAVKGVRYVTPLMLLQDQDATKVLLITLAETTPVSRPPSCRPTSNAPASTPGRG